MGHSSRRSSQNTSMVDIDLNAAGDSSTQQNSSSTGNAAEVAAAPPPQNQPNQVDPNTCDFITATQHGFTTRCIQLLESGQANAAVTDEESICPLHWAAINNRVDLIRIFISHGAVVDQIGGELGGTPLHWAVRQCCFQAVKILLDAGADPTIMDTEGYSTFHIAAQLGSWPILSLILTYSNGAHLDIKDINGRTPIMMALIGKQLETTRSLCALGAKLNAQDKNLDSVLHHAVLNDFAGGINTILSFIIKHTHGFNSWGNNKQKGSYLFPPSISFRKMHETLQQKNAQKLNPLQLSKNKKNLQCNRTLERFEGIIPEDIYGARPMNQVVNNINPKRENVNIIFKVPFKILDKILFKIFGNFTVKQQALFSYFLPIFVLTSYVALFNSANYDIFPGKILLFVILNFFVHYISNNLTTTDSNKFFPIGLTSALKMYGMGLAIFKYSKYMSVSWIFLWLVCCPFTWYCLYRCAIGDPGFVEPFYKKNDKIESWDKLRKNLLDAYSDENKSSPDYNSKNPCRICTSCMVKKPIRSKHCGERMLDHCVGRFDHYCPWVINAVGYKNHQWFLGYLFMVLVICGLHGYACLTYMTNVCQIKNINLYKDQPLLQLVHCDYWTTVLVGLMGIFSIWVFLLLTTQLWMNVIEGSTTNESMNFRRYAGLGGHGGHGHGHGPGRRGGGRNECPNNSQFTPEELKERALKAKQFMPLKMSVTSRFLDLFRLRRRNIDWSSCYSEDDLVAGGLMKRVDMEV